MPPSKIDWMPPSGEFVLRRVFARVIAAIMCLRSDASRSRMQRIKPQLKPDRRDNTHADAHPMSKNEPKFVRAGNIARPM
jgi:hypothetical protein